MTGTIGWLIVAAVAFAASHILLSGTRLRDMLVARLGEGPFIGLFSVVALAAFAWLVFAYANAYDDSVYTLLWQTGPGLMHVTWVIMVFAVYFVVAGFTTPNPSAVAGERHLDDPDPAPGVLKITRHPVMWGVALWAVAHLFANGDAASVILCAAILVTMLAGLLSQDAKKKRQLGARWDGFAAKTSFVPFVAMIAGRAKPSLPELGWWRFGLTVIVYAALAILHPYVIGVSPLPM